MNNIETHHRFHHPTDELYHINNSNCRYCVSERTKRYGNIYNNRLVSTRIQKAKPQNSIVVLKKHIDDNCSVCLLPLDRQPVQLSQCKHYFHYNCMDKWLDVKLSCPICRSKVLDVWIEE